MAVTHRKPGTIEPIIYFRNQRGHLMIMPSDEDSHRFRYAMGKIGYEMMFAETLAEAQKFQKAMQKQLHDEQLAELSRDEMMTFQRRQAVRDRMFARRNSASCSKFERDFIDGWLAMREYKHDQFKKRFTAMQCQLDALEYDNPDKHIHDLMDRV